MSDIKMSDVFGLPLVVCRTNPQMITAKPTYKGKTDYYYATIRSPVELEINYATHAINNHDRLTEELQAKTDMLALVMEENAQQRESLDAFRELVKKLIGNGIDLLNVDDVEDEEDAASIHAKFNDVVNEAGALLAKHKA